MRTKLHVYDFDGTLFKSPEKPLWWKGGWWGNLDSLTPPCVPEHPGADWWNDSVVARAKQSLTNPEVRTIFLTGRIPKFSLRVKELLKQVGLHFDEMYFATGGATEQFKLKTIKGILDEEPGIRGVSIWEDRGPHLRMFADWVESNGRACIPHLITTAPHPLDCPPPEGERHSALEPVETDASRIASAMIVAARYKSKTKDDEGNVHYEYSDRQVKNRHNEKADRVEQLRKDLKDLRKKVKTDLTSKDDRTALAALAAALIDETCERVGNDESAKEGHFGVTGWQKKHVSFSNGKATLKYVGKSGVDHEKTVEAAPVVKMLKELAKGKKDTDCLLSRNGVTIKPEQVNDYLSEFEITAKDIRGLRANQEMCRALKEQRRKGPDLPRGRKDRDKILKKEFADALEEVADIVGHEKATLRSDYLVPGLEDNFMKDGTIMSTFKEATKTESEREDESVSDMVKPNPKFKPPRDDLRNHRLETEDKDLKAEDDDLSLNYKRVAARLVMARHVLASVRIAARHLQALADDRNDEFLDDIEGNTYMNPETKERVKFQSLPSEEQKKIRAQWEEFNPPDEGGGGSSGGSSDNEYDENEEEEAGDEGEPSKPPAKPEEKAPEKPSEKSQEKAPEKPSEKSEEKPSKKDLSGPEWDEEGFSKEDFSEEKPEDKKKRKEKEKKEQEAWDKRETERAKKELSDKARSINDSPAFSDDDGKLVEDTLDSLLETMPEEDAEKFVENLVLARDVGIESLAKGKSPLRGKPPTSESIDKLKTKYNELSKEIEGLERSFATTGKERIEKLKGDRAKAAEKLQGEFSKFFVHAALGKAMRDPMTYISDTSEPLDKSKTKDRAKETISRYQGMTPKDREQAAEHFETAYTDTQDRVTELEDKISSTPYNDPNRESDATELETLKNRLGYLDADRRALELSSILEGDDTEDSDVPVGTRKILKSLHDSGVDVDDLVDAGLGLPGSEPQARAVTNLIRQMGPQQMTAALDAVDPEGRLSKAWEKTYGGGDEDVEYKWPFSMIRQKDRRKEVEEAFDVFSELLTDVTMEDAKEESEEANLTPEQQKYRRQEKKKKPGLFDFSDPGETTEKEKESPYPEKVENTMAKLPKLDIEEGYSNR